MSCACLVSERGVKDRLIYVNSDGELIFTVKGEKTEIICKDVSCDFDVTADRGGVGIAVVSLSGALLYFNFSGGEWRKYTVLDSRKSGKKILPFCRIFSLTRIFPRATMWLQIKPASRTQSSRTPSVQREMSPAESISGIGKTDTTCEGAANCDDWPSLPGCKVTAVFLP